MITSDSSDFDRLLVSLLQKSICLHYSVQFNMNYKMKNVERHSDTNMCQNMLRKRYDSDLKNKKNPQVSRDLCHVKDRDPILKILMYMNNFTYYQLICFIKKSVIQLMLKRLFRYVHLSMCLSSHKEFIS